MKSTPSILAGLLAVLLGYSTLVNAEDIDLYSGAVASSTDLPNVLFVIDSAANFSASTALTCTYDDTGAAPNMAGKIAGLEQCALNNAINALPTRAGGTSAVVNVGIMTYNAAGFDTQWGCNASGTGGCLLRALAPMTAAGKASLMAFVKSWTDTGGTSIKTNNEATAQGMQEAWAYYAGKTGMSGTVYPDTYSASTAGCQKNFVIFIGNSTASNGSPGDPSASPDTALNTTVDTRTNPDISGTPIALTATQQAFLKGKIQINSGPYGTKTFTCAPDPYTLNLSTGHGANTGLYADEWARYMKQTDLRTGAMPAKKDISTYTIGVLGSSCKSEYPALLTSMAAQGKGKFFPTANAAEIQQAILQILNEVQAVNSVFSSSSLPVAVNAQGTYINQIFMGVFRPDGGGNPRWLGNLKQYQFGYNATAKQAFTADATGIDVTAGLSTGFFSTDTASFWTCTNATRAATLSSRYSTLTTCAGDPANGFWANNITGTGLAYDLQDGEVVEKGGAAQILRLANLSVDYTAAAGTSTNLRKLYTFCPAGTGCQSTLSHNDNRFDSVTTAISDTLLGTGDRTITSITSAATVAATSLTPSTGSAPATITITNFLKGTGGASTTITATVASTAALVAGVTQFTVATGSTKYDCSPCTVVSIVDATTFTYLSLPGAQAAPATPYTATLLKNFATIVKAGHGLVIGQTMTISGCTTHTTLNTTTGTVTSVASSSTFEISITLNLGSTTTDTACSYTPKTATVTTATAHDFSNGTLVTISGATPAGYNGSNLSVTVTGTTTFTYQYTATAPLSSPATLSSAKATSDTLTRVTLTRWMRGEDSVGDESSICPPGVAAGTGNCPNPAVNIRPSVHGDVLHSQPVVINYGGATFTITGTSDAGEVRTATASAADVAKIGTTGSKVIFANGTTCAVTIVTSTTFTFPITICGAAGAQTAASGKPNVVVYYGDNNGVFHAVNGNQVNPPSSILSATTPGGEIWGFIATEFYGKLKRLHDNKPVMLLPTTLPGILPAPQKKDYFFDGPTGSYQTIDGLGRTTAAYIYLTMRRGGRAMYVLDVTDPTNPKFLWKIDSTTSSLFNELGQTWSYPKVARIAGHSNPVLIFGAGYDPAEDSEAPTANTMGRGIYVLDAITGAHVWSAAPGADGSAASSTSFRKQVAAMTYSIPSDITLIDRNSDGLVDRLYVGDVGGNVWRVNLEPSAGNTPNNWEIGKIAALGCSGGTCSLGTTPRKIMYPPEVLTGSSYDTVFVTTGDREHPLYTDPASTSGTPLPLATSPVYSVSACAVQNGAAFLKDTNTSSSGIPTTLTETNLFDATSTNWDKSLSGYKIGFDTCEKGVNAPTVSTGKIYFATNKVVAPTSTCAETLGIATAYSLDPSTGAYTTTVYDGGGFPATAVTGIVTITDSSGNEKNVRFCIGCGGGDGTTGADCDSSVGSCTPPLSVPNNRTRNYWYIEGK